ncbi:ABC transporter permease [Tenuibacillus multivorans]|uniref:ABC-type nitrate/sulfonate/bicarbonate transport system, permease component n=1 Tax=Tenuibacillus multivorans TaxID=237069 RepID=A0A1H0DU43_9BACI|nr:ABC transporter permease [Tenuibacillus multivorans]GEL76780.1 ABC transporter permease [Tenuibacillus multivorans]SDN73598.1 ABC-type nitrate/sulfonate/bicarbonate transport system, permease component [Tenuibacillus multivorans]
MRKWIELGWRPLLVITLLFIVWEVCISFFDVPDWLLPAPSQIFGLMISDWTNYSHHVFSTVELVLIGFVIGSSVGVIVAISLHLVPFLKQSMYPLLILSQNIPVIVLAPLLVIWFGFGILPKIIVITLVCFFPIAIALLDGFRRTDRDLMHYMKMAGATKKQIFWKLEWPHALPSLFSGLKISATYSVMGAVISEWLGASEGIGVYMTLASSSFRTDRVFVAIFIIVALSLLFFLLIMWLEKMTIRWQASEEGDSHGTSRNS